jgi:hypothetical protein
VGPLFEIFDDSWFGVRKVYVLFRSGVHSVSSDLHLHRRDAKFLSAGGLKVDLEFDTFGPSACCCSSPACCNCRLYSNYPVLLGFDMRPVEIAKVDLKKKLALLWYLLWVCIRVEI